MHAGHAENVIGECPTRVPGEIPGAGGSLRVPRVRATAGACPSWRSRSIWSGIIPGELLLLIRRGHILGWLAG